MIPTIPVIFSFPTKVCSPMHEHNKKKYMHFELTPYILERIKDIHEESKVFMTSKVINTCEGSTIRVKVPYKYNRVTCIVLGKTIQELALGDLVDIEIQYCGVWNVGGFSGPSWKLNSIQ